jgi:hypothetical protein
LRGRRRGPRDRRASASRAYNDAGARTPKGNQRVLVALVVIRLIPEQRHWRRVLSAQGGRFSSEPEPAVGVLRRRSGHWTGQSRTGPTGPGQRVTLGNGRRGQVREEVDMNREKFGRPDDWEDMEHRTSAIQCKIRSFAQFSRWLDGELAKLERRWAQPAVTGRPRRDRQFRPTQPR